MVNPQNSSENFKKKDYKVEKVSTGSYDFNKWLSGGYEKDIVSMLAGEPGSGKTNFCILVSCSQARKGKKVAYIDTEGGFSSERVKQIVEGNPKRYNSLQDILENILVFEPSDFKEQEEVFESLSNKITRNEIDCIIVDGMAMLYRLILGEASSEKDNEKVKEVNRQLASQMKTLASISRNKKIPVIITNQVYYDFVPFEKLKEGMERKINIVGGDLFKYWSKCIIQLENNRGKRTAKLIKHRSLPEKQMGFIIKNSGIYKKGWI